MAIGAIAVVYHYQHGDKTAALHGLDNDEELLLAMIAAFLDEAPVQLAELEQAQALGDLTALANAAHSLKGALSYLRAERARDCAAQLESAARHNSTVDYQQLSQALTLETKQIMTVLQQFLTDNT